MRRLLPLLLPLAALLTIAGCSRPGADAVPTGAPVIVISIDTLRADHLPAWGYKGVETPAIDALRKDSTLYRNAWSQVPLTLPSHVSILTGLLPAEHGVRNNLGYSFDGTKHESLPKLLHRGGYATGAAVSAWVLRGGTGLRDEFDWYDDQIASRADVSVGELARDGAKTAAAAKQWVSQNQQRPFFLLLHLFEPHTPYAPPEPFRSRYAQQPYDGEIAAADAIVGQFLEWLKAQGLYERSTIVLLSDHGEGLGDHGESEHGVFVYREAIHVPLMIKLPRSSRGGETVEADVQLIDLYPTIAALAGIKPQRQPEGAVLTGTVPEGRAIHSESLFARLHFGWSGLRSLVQKGFHYIEAPKPELYDLAADPAEKQNVLADNRRVYSAMRAEVERSSSAVAAPAAVSKEEEEKLASLGYLGSLRPESEGALPDPKDRIGDLEEMRRASAAEHAGRFSEALEILRALVNANPAFTDAWLRIAAIEERRADWKAAETAYKSAINGAPSLAAGIAVSLGTLQYREGRLEEAEAHARLGLQKPSAAPGAHMLLARIALAKGDAAATETEARAAMAERGLVPEGTVILARAAVLRGDMRSALELLDRAAAEAGEPVLDLEATRADLLARANRGAEAIDAFRRELTAFPQNREAWTRLAVLYYAMGNSAEAEKALEAMWQANRSPSTARLAAATWRAVENPAAAARWDRMAREGR